jgi:hypothetical protein
MRLLGLVWVGSGVVLDSEEVREGEKEAGRAIIVQRGQQGEKEAGKTWEEQWRQQH